MRSDLDWAWALVLLSSLRLLLFPIFPATLLADWLLGLGANLHFVQVGQVLRGQPLQQVVVVLSLPQSFDQMMSRVA